MTGVPPGDDAATLRALLPLLRCTACGDVEWQVEPVDARAWQVRCAGCGAAHLYRDEVLWIATPDEHPEVVSERQSVAAIEASPDLGGWRDGGVAAALRDQSLQQAYRALPYATDLPHFQQPGYFINVARFAPEFDLTVEQLARATLEQEGSARPIRLLDVGADGTWSTARLAARGFDCVALDITDHLQLARLYRDVAPPYAAINVDMHLPVFRDGSFDVITAFNALHHSTRLGPLVANLARTLRPGGLLGFVEPYVETDAQKGAFGDAQKGAGINENVHTLAEWHEALTAAGFSLEAWGLTIAFNAVYRKGGPARGFWDDAYRSVLTVEPAQAHVEAGVPARFAVSVANHGTLIWSSAPPRPIRLSYHVRRLTQHGAEMVAFDNPRTDLRGFLTPHDAHTYAVDLALDAPGTYEIEFDLVHETVTWFADSGGLTATGRLTVA